MCAPLASMGGSASRCRTTVLADRSLPTHTALCAKASDWVILGRDCAISMAMPNTSLLRPRQALDGPSMSSSHTVPESESALRVVIVEDEPLARAWLRTLMADDPELAIVG